MDYSFDCYPVDVFEDMDASYLINDYKGRINSVVTPQLYDAGYNVKVVNFAKPLTSNCYNPLKYARSVDDIMWVSKLLAHHISFGKKYCGHSLFETFTQNFLAASISYLHDKYAHLIEINNNLENDDINFPTLIDVLNFINKHLMKDGETEDDYINRMTELKNNVSEIMTNEKFLKLYLYCSQQLVSVSPRLKRDYIKESLLSIPFYSYDSLKPIFKKDDLELNKMNSKKTAIFVIYEDDHFMYNALPEILYRQVLSSQKLPENGKGSIPILYCTSGFSVKKIV